VNAVGDTGEPALTMAELQSILIIFLSAANDSTAAAIAWALHMLAKHQDVQARLRHEPDKIEAFVEEVLRQHGTVATVFRRSTRDAEVADTTIPAGSQIFMKWDSANYDSAKSEDPERFDIDRKGVRNHLAFGYGAHFCVGNTLARKEINMAVAAFLANFERIEAHGEPAQLNSFNVHALTALPLKLVRRP